MAPKTPEFPEWLSFLLDSTADGQIQTCRKHPRKNEDVYCSKCTTFECGKCFKDSKRHDDHKSEIIQLCGCTIKYDVIKKLNWSKSPKIRTGYSRTYDDPEASVALNPAKSRFPNLDQEQTCSCKRKRQPLSKSLEMMRNYYWRDDSGLCSVRCKMELELEAEAKKAQHAAAAGMQSAIGSAVINN